MLQPVVERYRERDLRRYFRGDAAFASPDIYEFLETEGYRYKIRLKSNAIPQDRIASLPTRTAFSFARWPKGPATSCAPSQHPTR